MYYNMRVRSAQRALAETRLSLIERKKTLLQLPEDCIRTLNHALKDVCKKSVTKVQHKLFSQSYKSSLCAFLA